MAKPEQKNDKKKGGIGAAFGAFSGVIDDIVKEVKQDLKEMTPEQKSLSARDKMLQEANSRVGLLNSAASGLSENTVAFQPAAAEPAQAPVNATPGLPAGNLWHALRNPAQQAALRTDAVYHALTPADVESYARALANESKPPFTLGLVAANLAALTEEELADGSAPELLTQALLRGIASEPRLFGALGAGPRQLWSSLDNLERFLLQQLNGHRKLIAVGPVGLDEPFAPYTLPQQQAQLALQLEIAADFGIPALLTTRKTQEKLAETLGSMAHLPALIYLDVLAGPEDVDLVQRFGMYALLRPEITAPDFAGKNYYRDLPSNKLLLASGSALVAPHGFAGHFNQPKFLENSLQAAAKLRGVSVSQLSQQVAMNWVDLLGVA